MTRLITALGLALTLAACTETPPAETPAAPAAPNSATSEVSPAASEAAASAPAAPPIVVSDAIRALLAAADRTEADRTMDSQRHPDQMLAFFGVQPGMKVAELGAGGGYTAELLARAVGPTGKVYGQNNKFIIERFAEKPWSARLATPAMKNVVRVDREFDDPLPPDATGLDIVFMVLFYHDTVWMETDRPKMLANIKKALKPGGIFAVIDHSGRPGTGLSETKTLHRIEEQALRDEVTRAGFKLVAEADFLRNPADTRDWNDAPSAAAERRGTSDRFVLKFESPAP